MKMVLKEWFNKFYSIIDGAYKPVSQKTAEIFAFNSLDDFLIAGGAIAGAGLLAEFMDYKATNNCSNREAIKGVYEEVILNIYKLQKYVHNIC